MSAEPRISLAEGGGGRASRRLLDELFLPAFDNPALAARGDSAVIELGGTRLALTTDGFVVSPLTFPGGDIGRLGVFGTCNDLAMVGAVPRYLSAAFILEEGLPRATLERVVASMQQAAAEAGVALVTGDTKVVDRGRGDGLYLTTSGVGELPDGRALGPAQVSPGDQVWISGDIGRHAIAVLAEREQLDFADGLISDCADLSPQVEALFAAGLRPSCLRDLTRGGLAAALVELALDAGVAIALDESAIPIDDRVRGACELLGFDPFHLACEGRMVALLPEGNPGAPWVQIGEVDAGRGVNLKLASGVRRTLALPAGVLLPRIC